MGEYLQDVFDGRADDGFEGNGYDWASLAQVLGVCEKCPHLLGKVDFDPEGSMFLRIFRGRGGAQGNLF